MSLRKKIIRALEFVLLFFGIPLFIFLNKNFLHPSIIVLPVLIFVFTVLRRTTDFRWKELITWNIPRVVLWKNAAIALGTLMVMLCYVVFFDPEHLFDLPRSHPWIFVALSVFYPVFSAFGQEVIYRTFLFRRYSWLFGREWPTIIASGVTFSFLHIVYYDPVSMIITLIGGMYFARIYYQTRSVLFTAVMHGIMGIIIFAVGMGRYFWLDMPV
jgi:membrane protease YdiL (CAAX protease family)